MYMEFTSRPKHLHRRHSYYEKYPLTTFNKSQSILTHPPKSIDDTFRINNYTYRTEIYLQQRDKQIFNKPPPSSSSLSSTTKTTWKNLKYQKKIIDDDQDEIDRILSTIDSIHQTFNRSLLMPYNQVYSSLYGNDNKSDRLMKQFCQSRNHFINHEVSMKDDDDDNNSMIQIVSCSFENCQDTDLDDCTEDEEEKENENEKKKSYDSGYGSVMPKRQFSREPLLKITQPLNIN